jgi:hypothetical protein
MTQEVEVELIIPLMLDTGLVLDDDSPECRYQTLQCMDV